MHIALSKRTHIHNSPQSIILHSTCPEWGATKQRKVSSIQPSYGVLTTHLEQRTVSLPRASQVRRALRSTVCVPSLSVVDFVLAWFTPPFTFGVLKLTPAAHQVSSFTASMFSLSLLSMLLVLCKQPPKVSLVGNTEPSVVSLDGFCVHA